MSNTVHPQHAYHNAAQISRIAEWKDFESELQKAAHRAIPNTEQAFAKVFVLTLEFAHCDFDCKTPRTSLTNLLQTKFGYQVENHIIETKTGQGLKTTMTLNIQVNNMISNWVFASHEAAKDESYGLILYYSGHALPDSTQADELKLWRTSNTQEPHVDWKSVRGGLGSMTDQGKVLILLDCCYASLAGHMSTSEILAACSWSDVAPVYMSRAFTTRIIASLDALSVDPYFTACQLMEHIKTSDAKTSSKTAEPIYLADRRPDAFPSFTFHRLPTNAASGSTGRTAAGKRKRTTVFGTGRILLSIQVADESTIPDKEQWKAWLVKIPGRVESVEVEILNMCESGSAIVMVVIPYTIWLAFEDSSPYTFIGVLKPRSDPDATRTTQGLGEEEDDGQPRLSKRSRSVMNTEAGMASGDYKF